MQGGGDVFPGWSRAPDLRSVRWHFYGLFLKPGLGVQGRTELNRLLLHVDEQSPPLPLRPRPVLVLLLSRVHLQHSNSGSENQVLLQVLGGGPAPNHQQPWDKSPAVTSTLAEMKRPRQQVVTQECRAGLGL